MWSETYIMPMSGAISLYKRAARKPNWGSRCHKTWQTHLAEQRLVALKLEHKKMYISLKVMLQKMRKETCQDIAV